MMDRNSSEITRDSFQNPNICHERGWELIKNTALFYGHSIQVESDTKIFLFLRGMVKGRGLCLWAKWLTHPLTERTSSFPLGVE
jgi:hypothetical protein